MEITSPCRTAVGSFAFTATANTGTPTITSFNPSRLQRDATITISGTSFDPSNLNNRVSFDVGMCQPM